MKYRQRGFTLIELLITLLLSSVVIAGVSQAFLQSRKSFTQQQALSFISEDGRYAIEVLTQELRRAGFLVNAQRNDAGYSKAEIFAADANASTSGIAFAASEDIQGSYSASGFNGLVNDINHLVFRYQLDPAGTCTDSANPNVPPTVVNKAECLANNYTWTQTATDLDAGNSPCSAQVSDQNGGAQAATTKTIYFLVTGTATEPTLSCYAESSLKDGTVVNNNGGASMPLVSNVEAMYVLYGEDTDSDKAANRYVIASSVTNWQKVVSVRVSLVLRSSETNISTASTTSYTIDGTSYNVKNPNDKRLYRVFTTTVAFRN